MHQIVKKNTWYSPRYIFICISTTTPRVDCILVRHLLYLSQLRFLVCHLFPLAMTTWSPSLSGTISRLRTTVWRHFFAVLLHPDHCLSFYPVVHLTWHSCHENVGRANKNGTRFSIIWQQQPIGYFGKQLILSINKWFDSINQWFDT